MNRVWPRDPPWSWALAIDGRSQFGPPRPGLLACTVRRTGPGSLLLFPAAGGWSCSSNSSVWQAPSGLPTPPRCGSTCWGWNAPEERRRWMKSRSQYQATVFICSCGTLSFEVRTRRSVEKEKTQWGIITRRYSQCDSAVALPESTPHPAPSCLYWRSSIPPFITTNPPVEPPLLFFPSLSSSQSLPLSNPSTPFRPKAGQTPTGVFVFQSIPRKWPYIISSQRARRHPPLCLS